MDTLTKLIQAARSGDRAAFDAIVRRFQDMAHARAYAYLGDSHLAQDAAQEAFIDAYLSLDKLIDPAAFPGWFHRIVIKHADRQMRRRKPEVSSDSLDDWPTGLPDPLRMAMAHERALQLRDTVATLPDSQRLAVTMFHLEGYSQKEVAEFLGLPVSTVKKRLFDARKNLKERMFTMVQDTLSDSKPSRDGAFERKVAFFIALRTGDLEKLGALLDEEPELIHAETEWAITPERATWAPELTPMLWASKAGNVLVLEQLAARGADVNERRQNGPTPLGTAILARRRDAVRWLVENGAAVNAKHKWMTPLEVAVMTCDEELVGMLLLAGADDGEETDGGQKAVNMAALKGLTGIIGMIRDARGVVPTVPVRETVRFRAPQSSKEVPAIRGAGRVVDASGEPIDGRGPIHRREVSITPILGDAGAVSFLELGIKVVDLLCPMPRGGSAAIAPCAGGGLVVLLTQIIRNVIVHSEGRVVYLGVETTEWTADTIRATLEDCSGTDGGAYAHGLTYVVGKDSDDDEGRRRVIETGLQIAEQFRARGCDVLLVVEGRLARIDGVMSVLSASAGVHAGGSITNLFLPRPPLGVVDKTYGSLDAVLRLSPERVRLHLYPAVDVERSTSRLIGSPLLSRRHSEVACRLRDWITRYYSFNLDRAYEERGDDCLTFQEEGPETLKLIRRARRLDRFLTQSFHGAESFTGVPGETVRLAETLDGCEQILNGNCDEVPEQAFYHTGSMERVLEKAKAMEA